MDTSFYREFLVLVDTLNFWEASSRLFMNESSLSKHIRKMEKELGVKLFDRSSRKVELTHYGKMMIPFAEKIVEAEMESRDAIRNAVEMENGVLMVGILPDATNYQLTDVLVRFSDAYPDAVIKALDNDTLELKQNLRERRCELAFIRESVDDPIADPDLVKIPYMDDYMVALVPESHPLAHEKEITLNRLKDENFILIRHQTYIHDLILDSCRKAGFIPHIAFQCNRLETILNLVSQGMGVSLLMNRHVENPLDSSSEQKLPLSVIPVVPETKSMIYLAYRKKGELSPVAQKFIDNLDSSDDE